MIKIKSSTHRNDKLWHDHDGKKEKHLSNIHDLSLLKDLASTKTFPIIITKIFGLIFTYKPENTNKKVFSNLPR